LPRVADAGERAVHLGEAEPGRLVHGLAPPYARVPGSWPSRRNPHFELSLPDARPVQVFDKPGIPAARTGRGMGCWRYEGDTARPADAV
jgi:hypothetical protein